MSRAFSSHGPLVQSVALRYVFAFAVTATTVAARLSIIPWVGNRAILILFVIPITLAAWVGGSGPGLLATVMAATAASFYLLEPTGSFAVRHLADIAQLATLAGAGAMITFLIANLRLERRRTAESLAALERATEHRERLAAIVGCSNDAIIGKDLDGVITSWNRGAERLFGYTEAEAVGQSIQLIIPLESLADEASMFTHIRRGESASRVRTKRRCKDGRTINVSVTLSPIRNRQGQLVGAANITHDITDQIRAEEQLRFQESILRETGHIAKVGGWHFDARTGEGYWTEEVARIHDLPPGAPISMAQGLSYYSGEDRLRIEAAIRAAIEEGKPYDLELQITTAANRQKWVRTIGHALAENGQVVCVRGSFQDITERKQMELALRESEQRFATAFRASPAAIAISRRSDRTLMEVNDSFLRLFGCTHDEIIGHTLAELGLLDGATIDLLRRQLDATGEARDVEVTVRTRAGAARHVSASVKVITLGGEACALSLLFDVTARREAEHSLRASEERFRQVVESISEVFWMTTLEGREMLYISPGFERIWGRSCESLYAQPESWIESIHPADRPRVVEAAATKQAAGTFDETYRIQRPDGTVRWIHDRAFPIADEHGRVHRIVGVAEDITDRKTLESQFLRSQRIEAIGTLSSGIAHDLNNILAPALMLGPALRSKLTSPDDLALLDIVERGALRGASIIRQLLTFSRGIEGQRGLVNARHLLREMAGIMRETFPRDITVAEHAPADLWPVTGDATQLHQVLMNLTVNARDAMPNGGKLTLTAENTLLEAGGFTVHVKGKPGPYVLLTVADTGAGIPQGDLDRIFEPFYTTKDVGKGTGLGLSTVLGIVKSHEGFVTVYSELGRGSVFKVYLPAAPQATETTASAPDSIPRGRGELVLVVDDEAAIRLTLQRLLEMHGYEVAVAANGNEGVATFLAQRERVQALITDIMMPEMNGVVLIRALRALEPNLKVIAMSGLQDTVRRDELSQLGVTEILSKPALPRHILEALHRQLAPPAASVPPSS
ncbi:PAS domain S-box protein [Opitutus sp. ER46]|uniref:PAS domain S-box protein n=1 Tax=Opitutus sp. ER46 TaxID=2161864 RepID=UPI0013049BEF|nr:PAS domain S-box protein [Opitutus sp. ER46]